MNELLGILLHHLGITKSAKLPSLGPACVLPSIFNGDRSTAREVECEDAGTKLDYCRLVDESYKCIAEPGLVLPQHECFAFIGCDVVERERAIWKHKLQVIVHEHDLRERIFRLQVGLHQNA